MCMHVCLHVHICTTCIQCRPRLEGGVRSPGTVDTDSSARPCGFRVLWKSGSACTHWPGPPAVSVVCFENHRIQLTLARDSFQLWILLSLSTSLSEQRLQRWTSTSRLECWGRIRMLGIAGTALKSHPDYGKLLLIRIRCNKKLSCACGCSDVKDGY